jgi:hypothetical protein
VARRWTGSARHWRISTGRHRRFLSRIRRNEDQDMTSTTDDFDAGPARDAEPVPRRKPRIALMGEFSAGKSTLTNLMLGRPAIPTKVTATQLPPVWVEAGEAEAWREAVDGSRHPLDPDRLEAVPVAETAFLHLYMQAEVLEVCDLIDTPGISDPNMAAEVWQRAAEEADGVIWLTHATQAWRQSEAAVWDQMPESLRSRSLLLVTRIDKLLTESDRARVLHRVRRETAGKFRTVLPISLIQALAAGEDADKWAASGGEAFSDALLELIEEIERRLRLEGDPRARRSPAGRPAPQAALAEKAALVAPPPAAEPPARPALRAVERPLPPTPAEIETQNLRAALAPEPPQPASHGLRVVSNDADGPAAAQRAPTPRRVTPAAPSRMSDTAGALRPIRPGE